MNFKFKVTNLEVPASAKADYVLGSKLEFLICSEQIIISFPETENPK